jgi:type II restriction/modification system DNA methylase subunit YeeA
MDVNQFIDKWGRADRTERQAAQEHFIDLCRMLGEPTPNEAADPGAYSFEKGASKIDSSPGFADVWKRGHFGWEYKKDRANLDRAYQQLQLYSVALENPPLLVVSDTKRFRIYTNWTNTVQTRHEFPLEDLAHSGTRELLKNVFNHPDRLKPDKTREQVTKDAAREFTTIAERLRMAGHPPEKVAHFLNRLVFCLFAEDVNLLENDLFKRMLDNLVKRRDKVAGQSQRMFTDLFREMRGGGNYGLEHILHFNGGLFDDDTALPLDADSLDILRNIARLDWSAIDPSIFGTLFERFLDPDKRAQIGAHYTDPEKIMMIVNPVIVRPLTAEWETIKAETIDILSRGRTRDGKPGPAALSRAEARLDQFLKRLDDVRILDPACGSGNFLYLALQSLKDLERRAIVEAHEMGLGLRQVLCGPHNVKGIEINPYAAELARTSIWIGNIQWLRRNGFEARKEPVLEDLDAIECRDALVTRVNVSAVPASGFVEAQWPAAEFIIGNPPFLGASRMISGLGEEYVDAIRETYLGRVPGFADLVCFWFAKADEQLKSSLSSRVGLVATNSIRGGENRFVLDQMEKNQTIFEAWSDEEWVVDGAAVRVSIVCVKSSRDTHPDGLRLDGKSTVQINADLTSSHNLIIARRLVDNASVAFLGTKKGGPFDLSGNLARAMIASPVNPNGRGNIDVIRPRITGSDMVRRAQDEWVIDFGHDISQTAAALYELPFQYALEKVKPIRDLNRRARRREIWWLHSETAPGLRRAIKPLSRMIGTPRVAKYRLFVWLHPTMLVDDGAVVVARADDTSFGILHSRFHESWSLRLGTWLGVGNDPRYTPTTTFETFPFPKGLTPNIPAPTYADNPHAIAIAKAAKRLDELRSAWLNPPDLIDVIPEVVPGYPDRILPKNEEAAAILKKRTLTNLYNTRPQWLADAHRDLDAAVATAYGWPADISEEDALAKLLGLNLSRAGAEAASGRDKDKNGDEDTSEQAKAPRLTREEFAKISEVEGLRLSEPMKQAFADFDRRGLSPEERRQAIIDRFKQTAK